MKYRTLPVLLNIEEAALIVGVSRRTINNLITSGEIRSTKIGRSRRIPTQPLLEHLGLDPNLVLDFLNNS